MGKSVFETAIGAVVLAVALSFAMFAYSRAGVTTVDGYEVKARFSSVDGLGVGDDVRISGIKVGSVVGESLDPTYFQAVLLLSIDSSVQLPEDTTAAVVSEGLLGGKYVAIDPGGADAVIPSGGEITHTQSAVNLESLLGKFIYGAGDSGGGSQ